MAGKKKLVSQSEYARSRGYSHQYINKLVRQGKICLIDGLIDPERADQDMRDWCSYRRLHLMKYPWRYREETL